MSLLRRRLRRVTVAAAVAAAAVFLLVEIASLDLAAVVAVSPRQGWGEEEDKRVLESGWRRQQVRSERIRSSCQDVTLSKKGTSKDALPLISSLPSSGLSRHHHVLYCHVPKAASTAWMQVMASLGQMDPKRVEDLTSVDRIHKEMLEGGHSVNASSPSVSGDIRIVFVRHPFSRLASAYHDKMVTRRERSFYQPLVDFQRRGALSSLLQSLLGQGGRTKKKEEEEVHISFADFVRFVIHELNSGARSYGSLHWLPAARLCDPCARLSKEVDGEVRTTQERYNFVGQMETLSEDVAFLGAAFPEIRPHLRSVFRRKWNSNAVAVAVAKEEEGRAEEPTLTSKYFSQLPPELIRSLAHVYRDDFQLFGYSESDHL